MKNENVHDVICQKKEDEFNFYQTLIEIINGNNGKIKLLQNTLLQALSVENKKEIDWLEMIFSLLAILKSEKSINQKNNIEPKASIEIHGEDITIQTWTTSDASDIIARKITDREYAQLFQFFKLKINKS